MSLLTRAVPVVVALAAFAPGARAAAPVPPDAGKAVAFPFPAKAPLVVQLTGIGAARERLSATLKAALPDDFPAIDKQIDEGLKELLAGRKLTAVPKDGRVYLVVNDLASLFGDAPAVSLLVPVTSYKEFRATFLTDDERKTVAEGKGVDEVKVSALGADRTAYMVDLKEYVALSPDKGTADIYATKFTRSTSATMPADLAKSFLGSDLALFVNFEVINEQYAEQIKEFKGFIDFGLQGMGGVLPGFNKRQLEASKAVLASFYQGLLDCRGLVVAAEFRPEGFNLRVQAQFVANSTTANALGAETPGPLADLGKLPAGLAQYTGVKLGKTFSATLRGLNPEFSPADDDEKGNAAVDKHLDALLAAGPLAEVSGGGAGDAALSAATYADPKKAVDALLGCYGAMPAGGRVQGAVLKDPPKVTKDAKKHAGLVFSEVALAFDFEATVQDLPDGVKEATGAQLKRLLAEKTTRWIGTDGTTVVQVTARDWAAAAALLDGYGGKKAVGETEPFKLARKQLPADASFVTLLETGQTAAVLLDALRAMEGAVPGFPKLGKAPALKGGPTFVAVAVTLKGETATLDLFVPGATVAAARKIIAGLLTKIE